MKYNAQTGQWENEPLNTSPILPPTSAAPLPDLNKWNEAKAKLASPAPVIPNAPAPVIPIPITPPKSITSPVVSPVMEASRKITTTTSQPVQTPEEKKLQGELGKLENDSVVIQQRQNEINTEKAKIDQEKAAEDVIRKKEIEEKKNTILTEADAKLKAGMAEANDQYEKFKKMEIKDFWADKSTGTKVAAAIAVGLGAFGAGLTGRNNDAMNIMQNAITQDFDKQRAQILQQKDVVTQAYGNIDQGNKWMEMQLARLDLKEAAAMDRVAATIADKKARSGVSEQEIKNDAVINGLRQQSTQRKANVEQSLRKQVQSNTEAEIATVGADGKPINKKPLSAEQQQRYDNAAMALVAVQKMRKALEDGDNTFSIVGDNDFTMNRRNFEEAFGRMQSGGAMTEFENQNFEDMAPTWTDSAERQKEKLAQLEAEMKARLTGLGKDPDEAIKSRGGDATKTEPNEVKRKTPDGKTAVFNASTKEFIRYE